MHCLYFICERKFYARTHVKITRHWKSTLIQVLILCNWFWGICLQGLWLFWSVSRRRIGEVAVDVSSTSTRYRIYWIHRPRRVLNFWTMRVCAYSRWALIRGWVLIKFSTFWAIVVCLFGSKTINLSNTKTRTFNKARFLYSEGNSLFGVVSHEYLFHFLEVGCWWALINFFCLYDGRLFEGGANSRLGAYSNKYDIGHATRQDWYESNEYESKY